MGYLATEDFDGQKSQLPKGFLPQKSIIISDDSEEVEGEKKGEKTDNDSSESRRQ